MRGTPPSKKYYLNTESKTYIEHFIHIWRNYGWGILRNHSSKLLREIADVQLIADTRNKGSGDLFLGQVIPVYGLQKEMHSKYPRSLVFMGYTDNDDIDDDDE